MTLTAKISAATIVAAGICLPTAAYSRTASDPQPNVILIMADDLGHGDLGCKGHETLKTPRLDGLAESGLELTNYYSGATVCTPSRMALMTGSYPVRLGWRQGVVGYMMDALDGLHPDAVTLAEVFRDAGYATGMSGKWHLGGLPETRPHRQGFETAYYISMSNNQTKKVWRNDEVIEDPFENRLLTRQFTDEALEFIRTEATGPFFLYLAYSAPHFPVEANPAWEGRSQYGAYGDVVEELDACVGEVLDLVSELALEKRTIVLFTSDNGPNPGEAASSLPFRGEKWSALEGGTRVPAIISWPGMLPAGASHEGLSCALDLLPTLCSAAGIDMRARSDSLPAVDGLDLWNSWTDQDSKHPRSELLFWHGRDPAPQAIRSGKWKLFLRRRDALEGSGTRRRTQEQAKRLAIYLEASSGEEDQGPMLINLETDPGETRDVREEFPLIVEQLSSRLVELSTELSSSESLSVFGPSDR